MPPKAIPLTEKEKFLLSCLSTIPSFQEAIDYDKVLEIWNTTNNTNVLSRQMKRKMKDYVLAYQKEVEEPLGIETGKGGKGDVKGVKKARKGVGVGVIEVGDESEEDGGGIVALNRKRIVKRKATKVESESDDDLGFLGGEKEVENKVEDQKKDEYHSDDF